MIINIRGTSGTGKSTLVRDIMALYKRRVAYRVEGRKQPIGYFLDHPHVGATRRGGSLAVVGHYETDCGGCDTINKMDKIFELVRQAHRNGFDVLFEGLLISADVNRVAALHQDGLPLRVFAIELPIEECLSRVNGRRRAKAARTGRPTPPDVNPKNTRSKHKGVVQSMARLRALGVTADFGTNAEVLATIKRELQL